MSGFDFSRNEKLALFALIGLSAIGLSVAYARSSFKGSSGEVVLHGPRSGPHRATASASDPMPGSSTPDSGKVIFQVAGCVKAPGVYSLASGKRVMDAVEAAGGAAENADLQAINLAAKIEDGSRIYVPSVQETKTGGLMGWSAMAQNGGSSGAQSASSGAAAAGGKLRVPGEGVVHINSADEAELQRLPGVGPATARKIIDYRSQVGRFRTPEQLIEVKGIGPKTFEKMRPFVSL